MLPQPLDDGPDARLLEAVHLHAGVHQVLDQRGADGVDGEGLVGQRLDPGLEDAWDWVGSVGTVRSGLSLNEVEWWAGMPREAERQACRYENEVVGEKPRRNLLP